MVVKWLGNQTCDQHVTSLNPGCRAAECNLTQFVYTRTSVIKQPMGGDGQQLNR